MRKVWDVYGLDTYLFPGSRSCRWLTILYHPSMSSLHCQLHNSTCHPLFGMWLSHFSHAITFFISNVVRWFSHKACIGCEYLVHWRTIAQKVIFTTWMREFETHHRSRSDTRIQTRLITRKIPTMILEIVCNLLLRNICCFLDYTNLYQKVF